MKTPILFKIRCLKNQIAACLREISKGVKKYILNLCDLEQQLEKAEEKQMTNLIGTEKQIKWAISIKSTIRDILEIGAEELIRREVAQDVEQNGSYESEDEKLKAVQSIVARKVATLTKPKEAKGMARLMNYEKITDASDLIAIGEGVDVSWKGFFKLISSVRGDHYSYLD